MNSKKNTRAGNRGKRVARRRVVSVRASKHQVGPENRGKSRGDLVPEDMTPSTVVGEGGAGKANPLAAGPGEQTENRGAPPALPTPMATFTI